MMDLFLPNTQLFTSQDVTDILDVDLCDVFISCLDSHSDGTHSLQRNVMLNFSKSVLMKKQTHLGRPEGFSNF